MNKEQFEHYLFNPGSLTQSSIAELKQVVDEYPFFQTAHMLYLKSLHQNQSISYTRQLKETACFVNDRSLLFKLIKGLHSGEITKVQQADVNPGAAQTTPASEPIHQKKADETPLSITQETSLDQAETTQESKKTEPDISSMPKESLNDLILRRLKEIEDQNSASPSKIENNTQEEATPGANATIEIKELKSNESLTEEKDSEPEATNKLPTENIDLQNSKDSEDDLLGFDYSVEITEDETPEPDIKKSVRSGKFTPQSIDYIHNLEQKVNASQRDYFEIEKDENEENTLDKNETLIDAFLEKNPRITQQRPKQNSPLEDISETSVQETEIMTETIAKIYLAQKQYEKAKKIYETLSLKYPQKSIYFADQISKIKELINNK